MEKGNLSYLICAGFPQKEIEDAFKIFKDFPPGMVIIFSENFTGKNDLRDLCKRIKKLKGGPLISIDMEGGRVNRLKKIIGEIPAAEEYGKWEESKIEKFSFKIGKTLKEFGIDINFAPCVDLGPVKEGTGLEGRTISDDPEEIKLKAKAFLKGLWKAGIIGCIKHYPGLGASEVDSHKSLPFVNLKKNELNRHIEIFNFLKNYSPVIMVSHCVYTSIDKIYPASISKKIIKMIKPYKGLIISDDLEMGALSSFGDLVQRAYLSLKAGCNMVIISKKYYKIPEILNKINFKEKISNFLSWKRRTLRFINADLIPDY